MDDSDYNSKMPAKSDHKSRSRNDISKPIRSINELNAPPLEDEKKRAFLKKDADGRRIGFGSCHDHPRYDLSMDEKKAGQGHPDRIRMTNMSNEDALGCYDDSDNPGLSYDWKGRTGYPMKEDHICGSSGPSKKLQING